MLTDLAGTPADHRWQHSPVYRWWRRSVVDTVDQRQVMERIAEDSGWSGRYAFMTTMSAGIAVLGLLLSSPAVVIGAMLISPLMGPILGLGFSVALFDYTAARRSLIALLIGSFAAIVFTALIVLASPLKAPTAEILARTRPNLFDLLVALFAALAGTFAIIRGRGETIVGVAIATALMPPLAVVGFGLATWNMPVLGGSLALFVTNLMTIALAATVMARFYGFGHYLSGQQGWTQTIVLTLVFLSMSVPLGFSLNRIARETVTASQVRAFLAKRYGDSARVTQLDIAFDRDPISVQSVVIAPRGAPRDTAKIQADLAERLGQPVKLQVDLVLLDPRAGAIDAQRAELQQASAATAAENAVAARVADLVALGAGIVADDVTIDRDHHRATGTAARLPGATSATYRALEKRISDATDGWAITIVPPSGEFPTIRFAENNDTLDAAAKQAVALSIWQAKRWNVGALAVPGLTEGAPPEKRNLNQRRAQAIAEVLRAQAIRPVGAPPAGQAFALAIAPSPETPDEVQ